MGVLVNRVCAPQRRLMQSQPLGTGTPALPSPGHTLADLVTAPISEYRSELSGKFSTTMVHTWWRSDCLCTVSLTSGTFSR